MEESNKHDHWWQSFFKGPWESTQLEGYPEERTRTEVDFALAALQVKTGSRILDVPCGIGRHTNEFARRGFQPTGVDFNGAAIAVARNHAVAENLSSDFVVGDMREIDFTEQFDAAICFFGSFGYFDDEDNLKFASRVARALCPGAGFLIETHVAESLFPIYKERSWLPVKENPPLRVMEERRFDIETGRIHTTWTFVTKEGMSESTSSIRIYSYRELCGLLKRAGFSKFHAYETGKLEPFGLGSSRLSLVAIR
jgi:SAM-dependent methyltransferase